MTCGRGLPSSDGTETRDPALSVSAGKVSCADGGASSGSVFSVSLAICSACSVFCGFSGAVSRSSEGGAASDASSDASSSPNCSFTGGSGRSQKVFRAVAIAAARVPPAHIRADLLAVLPLYNVEIFL